MPLVGTRELAAFDNGPLASETADGKARPRRLRHPPGDVRDQTRSAVTSLLPPALHPTVPPTIIFTFTKVPDSPAGPFVLAEAKIGARSGARPARTFARRVLQHSRRRRSSSRPAGVTR